jgi:hypothetical protein
MVKVLDETLSDLRELDVDVGLHGDIDLGPNRPVVARKPRQAIKGVSDRVEP